MRVSVRIVWYCSIVPESFPRAAAAGDPAAPAAAGRRRRARAASALRPSRESAEAGGSEIQSTLAETKVHER